MFGKQLSSNASVTPSSVKASSQSAAAAPPAPPRPSVMPTQVAPPKAKVSKEKIEQFNVLKMRLHRNLIDQLDLTRMVGDEETLREL